MFIRIKKIRKKDKVYQYAYIVENRWRKRPKRGRKGARQKVKGYLGRVYFPDKQESKDFFEHYNINDIEGYVKDNKHNRTRIVNELVKLELINHGFKEKEGILFFNSIFFDIGNNELHSINEKNIKNKKVVLKINDGFMCNETINKLVKGSFGDETGYEFAKAFVDAGINIPKELFVKLYESMVKL